MKNDLDITASGIDTELTQMMQCRYPIIVAPMFLVSNKTMVIAGSEAGAIGAFPALNYRPVELFQQVIREIKSETSKPFGVNIIINPSNIYHKEQTKIVLDEGVPLIIASLGGPKELIKDAHKSGIKVFMDVVSLEHALKAQDAGADAIIAVNSAAGGHRGTIEQHVLVPFLRKHLFIPIISAGGIMNGESFASAIACGASGVQIGTRFIASHECSVTNDYKQAIITGTPHDIVTTYKLDGLPAHVIQTAYVKRVGAQLSLLERFLFKHRQLRRLIITIRSILSYKKLETSTKRVTWKQLWGAGQGIGLVKEIQSIETIIRDIIIEYQTICNSVPHVTKNVSWLDNTQRKLEGTET